MPKITVEDVDAYRDSLAARARNAHGVDRWDTDPLKVRAAVYARVSTAAQTDEDRQSLPEQIRICKKLADHRNWDIAAVYWDVASAERANRPAYQQMLADARTGAFTQIIAWKDDRLWRGFRPAADLDDVLRAVRELDVTFAEGVFSKDYFGIYVGIAMSENRTRVNRMRLGKASKARNGQVPNGRPPYGYKTVDKRLERHPGQWEYLEDICRRTLDGESTVAICERLNALGVPRPTEQARNGWTPNYIHKLLANPILAGRWPLRVGGETIEIPAPAVVTEDEYALIRAIIKKRGGNSGRPAKHPAPLAGMLFCAERGYAMSQQTYTRYKRGNYVLEYAEPKWYYRCSGMDKWRGTAGRQKCRPKKELANAIVFPVVYGVVMDVFENPAKYIDGAPDYDDPDLERPARVRQPSVEIVSLEQQAHEYEQRLDEVRRAQHKVFNLYDNGEISEAMLSQRLAMHRPRERWLTQELARIKKELERERLRETRQQAVLAELQFAVGDFDPVGFVRRYVERIEVDRNNRLTITIRVPEGETVRHANTTRTDRRRRSVKVPTPS
jgi:DNA invertase Pin-like site-specific DNA recombinase